ncbi:MAG: LysM peptidoglycan-binding domain-containing protein, partial [Verrucomicrobiota bacterium]
APPPAAYPSSPEGYADSTGGVPVPPSSAAPTPAAPEPPEFKLREGETLVTYRIERGDSLSKIAGKYNTSISRIMAANAMTSDRIYAGKSLQIPTAAPPGLVMNAPAPPAGASSTNAGSGYYGSTSPTTPTGRYSSVPSSPSVSSPSYPSTTAPAPISTAPASTSYPRVDSPPIPPQTQQPAGAFPTPSFGGGGGVQFSE